LNLEITGCNLEIACLVLPSMHNERIKVSVMFPCNNKVIRY
jgi:hypothetical protein